ncbi:MAG: 30S ribosomal protein S3 [Candidatus Omnitrophica bacterium]|nr:30S ribosomal protein S3 [Candidatus Omnitrophota bacterium]
MGQKVHPYSFRLGYIKDWKSKWFTDKKKYPQFLYEDVMIRKYIKQNLSSAAISDIRIERASDRVRIIIHTARPGVIIGRRGSEIDRLKDELQGITQKNIFIDIKEVKNAACEAQIIAENMAFQLEKRIPFRRVMKKAVQNAVGQGLEGIKVSIAGRLDGSEIARNEKYKRGKIPLQTKRADVEYGFTEAHTTYGLIGIKVWTYKGDAILRRRVVDGDDAKEGKVPQVPKR